MSRRTIPTSVFGQPRTAIAMRLSQLCPRGLGVGAILVGCLSACAPADSTDLVSQSGGSTQSGGAGGASVSTGGASISTGGFIGTGGSSNSGGATNVGTGGMNATGGSTAASGGASATGGTNGRDAGTSTGGMSTGGGTGTGGSGSGGAGSGGRVGTGGAGTGGALGTGDASTGACTVSPIDPSATTQVKSLLCYLYSIYGNHVLSGQQETSWSNPAGDIDYYVKNVGKAPAILGGDYLYPSGTTSRAQAYWAAGGLTMMRYHMGAPPLSDTYDNSKGSTNYANVLTSGTNENKSLLSKLDYLAGELKTLQNANVVVILALYHEVQSGGWFWWAKGSGQEFVQLWQLSFDYLTKTKGIHNVIWLLPYSGSPNAAYFPGKAYADLCGPDEYSPAGDQPFSGQYKSVKTIVGATMPIPLHETGTIPQPASMFPSTAPWLLWNVWAGYQTSANTLSGIQSAYSSSYTITRDELPKF